MLDGITGSQVAVRVTSVNNDPVSSSIAAGDDDKKNGIGEVAKSAPSNSKIDKLKGDCGRQLIRETDVQAVFERHDDLSQSSAKNQAHSVDQHHVDPKVTAVVDSASTQSQSGIIDVKIEGLKKNIDVKNSVTAESSNDAIAIVKTYADTNLFKPQPQAKQKLANAQKRIRKGIFVSYSPEAGFVERKFIADLVRQLKENNLAEDIWFDKDEGCMDSPTWYSQRMEAVERCQACIIILSEHYFRCSITLHEIRTLIERNNEKSTALKMFPVLLSSLQEVELPKQYSSLLKEAVNLTLHSHINLSVAEKSSIVIGSVMEELEKFAVMRIPPKYVDEADPDFNGEYKSKKICRWDIADVQEWLYNLNVKEFYRQNLAENMVDGFLLMSLTDEDMIDLGIESKVVRKKIMQQFMATLDRERKMPDMWHLRARSQRSKANTVYLVYDPADVRLAQAFKQDLLKKGLQVINHVKLGQSKEEFLRLNGPNLASATFILLVLTESAIGSPFVFHEAMFAVWVGKRLLVAMYKNTWSDMRPSLKAVLGECLAVDFERNLYSESIDILVHHMKPLHSIPGLVLEQAYLTKMSEGLKPLELTLASGSEPMTSKCIEESTSLVFISFQWDMQSKIENIKSALEQEGFACWCDVGTQVRGHSSLSTRSASLKETISENLQSHIQRSMRNASAVLCCITPKYIQSDNCFKDIALAESLQKPIIPLLMRFCSWPPEAAPSPVKKVLAKCTEIVELYNDKLFKQNLHQISDQVRKAIGQVP